MHLEAAAAHAHWPHWQRSRCSSGMLRTAVDDGVVDFGLFSCTSRLAAWQEPIETGVQQLPARSEIPTSGNMRATSGKSLGHRQVVEGHHSVA